MSRKSFQTWEDLAKVIDHSMLKPDASIDEIKQACHEALRYGFATVAVNPASVPYCVSELHNTDIKVDVAIGFPLGQNTIETKVFETKDAISRGAEEVDFVINVVELKAGHRDYIKNEMLRIREAAGGLVVKAILETCYLTQDEKRYAAELAAQTGLDFVKTSTGFGPGGARKEDILLLRSIVGERVGIKAAGEITSLEKVLSMIEAGATRIGTRFSVKIIEEAKRYFQNTSSTAI